MSGGQACSPPHLRIPGGGAAVGAVGPGGAAVGRGLDVLRLQRGDCGGCATGGAHGAQRAGVGGGRQVLSAVRAAGAQADCRGALLGGKGTYCSDAQVWPTSQFVVRAGNIALESLNTLLRY